MPDGIFVQGVNVIFFLQQRQDFCFNVTNLKRIMDGIGIPANLVAVIERPLERRKRHMNGVLVFVLSVRPDRFNEANDHKIHLLYGDIFADRVFIFFKQDVFHIFSDDRYLAIICNVFFIDKPAVGNLLDLDFIKRREVTHDRKSAGFVVVCYIVAAPEASQPVSRRQILNLPHPA